MRGCMLLLTIAVAALAQEAPVARSAQSVATVPPGVPLRVALERRVAIKRVGEPIQGRLVDPIYVFDRVVLPAGSVVEGHIAEIGGVPVRRRLAAILSGNLTPPREVRAQFDALVLSDGSRLPLRTSLSRGTAHTMRIAKQRKKREERRSAPPGTRDKYEEMDRAAMLAFKAPGKVNRLKSTLLDMLPYHRQAWAAGTLFNGVLTEPLTAPAPSRVEARTDYSAVAGPAAQEVSARLLTPISSATARRGASVEAVVTRPLFSADQRLLIPEGSLLRRGRCGGATCPPPSPQRESAFYVPPDQAAAGHRAKHPRAIWRESNRTSMRTWLSTQRGPHAPAAQRRASFFQQLRSRSPDCQFIRTTTPRACPIRT